MRIIVLVVRVGLIRVKAELVELLQLMLLTNILTICPRLAVNLVYALHERLQIKVCLGNERGAGGRKHLRGDLLRELLGDRLVPTQ